MKQTSAPGDPEEPGACTGQAGKWRRLNGMWMKAVDSCKNWSYAPMKIRIPLIPEREPQGPYEDPFDFANRHF